jgi:excisionase family DNA binding protein
MKLCFRYKIKIYAKHPDKWGAFAYNKTKGWCLLFDEYPDIITIGDLADMLKIGKSSAYRLLRNNTIRHVRIGKKYIIPKKSVLYFLSKSCYDDAEIISGRLRAEKGAV